MTYSHLVNHLASKQQQPRQKLLLDGCWPENRQSLLLEGSQNATDGVVLWRDYTSGVVLWRDAGITSSVVLWRDAGNHATGVVLWRDAGISVLECVTFWLISLFDVDQCSSVCDCSTRITVLCGSVFWVLWLSLLKGEVFFRAEASSSGSCQVVGLCQNNILVGSNSLEIDRSNSYLLISIISSTEFQILKVGFKYV